MVLGDFKLWCDFYRDLMRGKEFTREEQDWIGKFMLFILLDARKTVRDCRAAGRPLPPILKASEKPPATSS